MAVDIFDFARKTVTGGETLVTRLKAWSHYEECINGACSKITEDNTGNLGDYSFFVSDRILNYNPQLSYPNTPPPGRPGVWCINSGAYDFEGAAEEDSNYAGDYDNGTEYTINQIVSYIVVDNFQGNWIAETEYNDGEIVLNSFDYYKSTINENIGNIPGVGLSWQLITSELHRNYFIANDTTSSNLPTDSDYWTPYQGCIGEWSEYAIYYYLQIVSHNGKYYLSQGDPTNINNEPVGDVYDAYWTIYEQPFGAGIVMGDNINGSSQLVKIGDGEYSIETDVLLKSLATIQSDFNAYVGLIYQCPNMSAGAYFTYGNANAETPSSNWNACSMSNYVLTSVDTGIIIEIDRWYRLKIKINALGTEITYYIDDALVATITTNIPTTIGPMIYIEKTTFSNDAAEIWVDWIWNKLILNDTVRPATLQPPT